MNLPPSNKVRVTALLRQRPHKPGRLLAVCSINTFEEGLHYGVLPPKDVEGLDFKDFAYPGFTFAKPFGQTGCNNRMIFHSFCAVDPSRFVGRIVHRKISPRYLAHGLAPEITDGMADHGARAILSNPCYTGRANSTMRRNPTVPPGLKLRKNSCSNPNHLPTPCLAPWPQGCDLKTVYGFFSATQSPRLFSTRCQPARSPAVYSWAR